MPKVAPTRSVKDLETERLEIVRNGLVLHPDLPAIQLSEILVNEADPGFLAEFGRSLCVQAFARTIVSERRNATAQEPRPSLFGFDDLPRRIITKDGKRPPFEDANATQLRAYLKTLNNKHRERIAQVKEVLKIMGKYTRKKRGITVAQASLLEAERVAKRARPAPAK
jgi:hypothetical protein